MRQARSSLAIDEIYFSARWHAPDRYFAALLAPGDVRHDLVALAAFAGEIERIATSVSEPMLGEIRIQWWRDAVLGDGAGRSGSPVADAFAEVVERKNLPLHEIEAFLDGQVTGLYANPPADDASFDHALDCAEGTLFRLAHRIHGRAPDESAQNAIRAGARAYALARLGLALPLELAGGRQPLPPSRAPSPFIAAPDWRDETAYLIRESRASLVEFRSRAPNYGAFILTMLPVALVEPYLRLLEKASHAPARDVADLAPVKRMARLARAYLTGRI